MSDTNYFLTDEFMQFSQKMAEVHTEKKAKQASFAEVKEAFQKKYDEYKAEVVELDGRAAGLVDSWENWKSSQNGQT